MTYPLPSSTDQIADLHLSTASRGAELNLVHGGAVDPADIIFGCGPIVTDRSGPIELTQVDAAVHAALEAGVVHFDTAPLYGDSEDRLGHALAASPLGSSAVVMTKAGKVILMPHMGSATIEGRVEMGEKVIINIRTFLDAHKPPDRVLPSML